jgi:predicted TIM-barrel fold metal-dependent hydrolase
MENNMLRKRLPYKVIAVEEHFMHPTLTEHFGSAIHQPEKIKSRLFDFAGIRIEEMDAAGVDVQVLSHQSPGSQRLSGDASVGACRAVNDALAAVISQAPDRFTGFAMIPTVKPEAAADELQRSVEELGLKGAMIHGLSNGEMVDGKEYWPIFARAEKLDVPIYLHPADPDKSVTERYYAPYDQSHPMFTRAAWGFGVETGTHAIRLILSGVFDAHPELKVLLGHFGEAIPFWMPRIHESLSRPGGVEVDFSGVFRRNFYVTTSGFFSEIALRCCLEALNPDHILFAIDWPYADNSKGVEWLQSCELDGCQKEAIFSKNAEALLGI